ncbi:hypothetical protein M3Y94_01117700 [Aphelenchoides besseyi]|nr:hypothetical protein M3Y94_01117700 [Aphelenchoides besseyi]KAI6219225.1 hypothetical protein M3Y95_01116800 [Aphelenchoides besseyi]
MNVLKIGYLGSSLLFVLCCICFFLNQWLSDVKFMHPDTGSIAIFEVSCIVYNLCLLTIVSIFASRICGCPPIRSSSTFLLIVTLSSLASIIWFGVFVSSLVSNAKSFLKIGLFCLLCFLQTLLLPAISWFSDDGTAVVRKPSSHIEAGMNRRASSVRRPPPKI